MVLLSSEHGSENVEILNIFICTGADVNQNLSPPLTAFFSMGRSKGSLLATAAALGKIKSVKLLLDAGANVNDSIEYGRHGSALIAGARGGLEIVKLILRAGANVNMPVRHGYYGSVLHAALADSDIEVMKYLIRSGADVDTRFQTSWDGSILAAVATRAYIGQVQTEIIELLLTSGANVNLPLLRGKYGNAICAAINNGYGNLKAVRQLLDAGADINIPVCYGAYGSALCAAFRSGDKNVELVKYLLNAGAELNMALHHGEYGNALCAAIDGFHGIEMMRLLIKAGADINMSLYHGNYGNTLCYAIGETDYLARPNIEAVKILLRARVDVNPKSGAGGNMGNPLFVAKLGGNPEMLQLLLDAGAKDYLPPTDTRILKWG